MQLSLDGASDLKTVSVLFNEFQFAEMLKLQKFYKLCFFFSVSGEFSAYQTSGVM